MIIRIETDTVIQKKIMTEDRAIGNRVIVVTTTVEIGRIYNEEETVFVSFLIKLVLLFHNYFNYLW